jgi:peptidoglycan-associated lipoprotein
MRLSSFYFLVSFVLFLTSCASTTDKQSILNTEADINYVESDAARAAREAQEEMDAQAAAQAELEAQAERERLRQEKEMAASGSNADEEVYGSNGAFLPTEKSIYFDYDMFKVKSDYAELVTKHGNYINSNNFYSVKLEGNCDERGGVEYNLALGDRRANSVKDALTALGVDSSRIETISYGSEKPIAFGKDEDSYSLNRRVDIVYLNN